MHTAPRRLDSWKAVAGYLGRDVRTAMRWHRNDGLPVHHISGGRGRAVYAFSDEIDAWLADSHSAHAVTAQATPAPITSEPNATEAPQPSPATHDQPIDTPLPSPRRVRAIDAAAVILAIALLTLATRAWRTGQPIARAEMVAGNTLAAFDAADREIWRLPLPHLRGTPNTPSIRVTLLDNGRSAIALTLIPLRQDGRMEDGEVMLVDNRRRVQWRRTLSDRVTFDGVEYGPPWYPDALVVYQVDGRTRITAAFHHHTWWPSVIATFDQEGRLVSRFVNSGWIYSLSMSSDNRHLIAAGVNNALGGGALAVLDASNPVGVSPTSPGAPVCSDCPAGDPVRYYVLPWSDMANTAHSPVTLAQVSPHGDIQLQAAQRRTTTGPALMLTLAPTFDIRQRTVTDSFKELHAQLERDGTLDHPFAACRWRVPPVQQWTPAAGWSTIR